MTSFNADRMLCGRMDGYSVQEIEAKYLVLSGKRLERMLDRMQQAMAWAGFRIQPKGETLQRDTYYDSDWQLRQLGWSFRLRRSGNTQKVTLKELTRSRGGVFSRGEVEQTLWQPACGVDALPAGAVHERLEQMLRPGSRLVPLFEIHNHRRTYLLSHPDHPRAQVEMALDQGQVAAASTLAFTEIEFELRQGSHEVLSDLLAIADEQSGLIRARLSKFERGLIAAGCQLGRRAPGGIGHVDAQTSWRHLARTHLKRQLHELKLYEPYAWESLHPEGVHQMRVATRRARAALRTFKDVLPEAEGNALEQDIRWLGRVLGDVRDLDVHLQQIDRYRSKLGDKATHALGLYQGQLLKQRRVAQRALLDALASDNYHTLVTDYNALLSAATQTDPARPSPTVGEIADQTVAPLLDRVQRRGRALDGTSPDKKLHRLRIDIKRLRYQLEYLLPAYPAQLTDLCATLRSLQDLLGDHQDACVARAQLTAYRRRYLRNAIDRKVFKKLDRREAKRAQRLRKRFAALWAEFEAGSAGLLDKLASTAA
ncbi:MAG: CHAD domain-containing protein [Pseudomonadales bacterium]